MTSLPLDTDFCGSRKSFRLRSSSSTYFTITWQGAVQTDLPAWCGRCLLRMRPGALHEKRDIQLPLQAQKRHQLALHELGVVEENDVALRLAPESDQVPPDLDHLRRVKLKHSYSLRRHISLVRSSLSWLEKIMI